MCIAPYLFIHTMHFSGLIAALQAVFVYFMVPGNHGICDGMITDVLYRVRLLYITHMYSCV